MKHLPTPMLEVLKNRLIRLRDNAMNKARIAEIRSLQSHATKDGETQDQAEYAETWREGEIDKAEITIDLAAARAADAALQRIANGSYGVCQDCKHAISQACLLALPIVLRCAECQQIREQSHGRP